MLGQIIEGDTSVQFGGSAELAPSHADDAERLFRQIGFQKTTVADIARELHMSPANVYRFFAAKSEINEAGRAASLLSGEDGPPNFAGQGTSRGCFLTLRPISWPDPLCRSGHILCFFLRLSGAGIPLSHHQPFRIDSTFSLPER
jgi:Bacterial regulatory proteins, tetR family